jgi:hypothetical protein
MFLRSTLILSSHPPNGLFPSGYPTSLLTHFSSLLCLLHTLPIFSPSLIWSSLKYLAKGTNYEVPHYCNLLHPLVTSLLLDPKTHFICFQTKILHNKTQAINISTMLDIFTFISSCQQSLLPLYILHCSVKAFCRQFVKDMLNSFPFPTGNFLLRKIPGRTI